MIRHSDAIPVDDESGRSEPIAASVTASDGTARCAWCRRPLPVTAGPGRPRRFCQQSCRQRDYEARRRARELDLGDHELIVARAALDALRDELYVLACAVEDVERDLAGSSPATADELRAALSWLLEAARPLCGPDRPGAAHRPEVRPGQRSEISRTSVPEGGTVVREN